jgi:hypothetical protein
MAVKIIRGKADGFSYPKAERHEAKEVVRWRRLFVIVELPLQRLIVAPTM